MCGHCERLLHPLCLQPPALSLDSLQGSSWECPSCGEPNQVSKAFAFQTCCSCP